MFTAPMSLAAVLIVAAALDSPAEPLDVSALAARTQGVVTVRVLLGNGREPATVQVLRIIGSFPSRVIADPSWIGGCVPDRDQLKRWLQRNRRAPQRAAWIQALRRPGYQAVVFLKIRDGVATPYCGGEALDLRHTNVHRRFASFVREVETELARRGRGGTAIN